VSFVSLYDLVRHVSHVYEQVLVFSSLYSQVKASNFWPSKLYIEARRRFTYSEIVDFERIIHYTTFDLKISYHFLSSHITISFHVKTYVLPILEIINIHYSMQCSNKILCSTPLRLIWWNGPCQMTRHVYSISMSICLRAEKKKE